MKFDQKTIATLLVGILIGGVGIGLIDANRPKPLFSSASRPIRTWIPISLGGCGDVSVDTGRRKTEGGITFALCEVLNAGGEGIPSL